MLETFCVSDLQTSNMACLLCSEGDLHSLYDVSEYFLDSTWRVRNVIRLDSSRLEVPAGKSSFFSDMRALIFLPEKGKLLMCVIIILLDGDHRMTSY